MSVRDRKPAKIAAYFAACAVAVIIAVRAASPVTAGVLVALITVAFVLS